MRRHRRGFLSGLFFNTGNYDVRTVEEGFGFSRQFTDTINQGMMDDERIEMQHRKEEELNRQQQAGDATDKPADAPENP